mmetsp:Transcript_56407/g.168830  ORF Transcript_56407/g.168830 Transcript_56407/m.168830 type:complete len:263 (+) Transcript_56407:515-1303(+)
MLHLSQYVSNLMSEQCTAFIADERAAQLFNSIRTTAVAQRKHGAVPLKERLGRVTQQRPKLLRRNIDVAGVGRCGVDRVVRCQHAGAGGRLLPPLSLALGGIPRDPPPHVRQGQLARVADFGRAAVGLDRGLEHRDGPLRADRSQGLAAFVTDHDAVRTVGQDRFERGAAALVPELAHDVGKFVAEERSVPAIEQSRGQRADSSLRRVSPSVNPIVRIAIPDGIVVGLTQEVGSPHPHTDWERGVLDCLFEVYERRCYPRHV